MKRSRQLFFTTVCCCVIASVMALSGCDNDIEPAETTEQLVSGLAPISISGEILPMNENTADAAELSDYPIIINNTVIDEKPETAICLSSSLTEIIYELGYGNKLIGRGSYCDYPEEVKALTDFGRPSSPDLAAVKNASPDVLITATAIPNIDAVALSDLGIKVVYIPSPHTVDEFGRIYKAIGMIFDGLFDGEENGSRTFSAIRSTLESGDITVGNYIYVTEGLSVAGGDTFENAVLSLFGTNIAAEASGYVAYSDLSPEYQPDTVIISDALSFDEVTADSVLGMLEAVKSGKMIKIGNSYFESPSGQIVNIVNELSNTGGDE